MFIKSKESEDFGLRIFNQSDISNFEPFYSIEQERPYICLCQIGQFFGNLQICKLVIYDVNDFVADFPHYQSGGANFLKILNIFS